MVKRAFVLKNVLIIIMLISTMTLSLTQYAYHQYTLYKNLQTIEKQRAVELILYSYFMAHLNNQEEKVIQYNDYKINYQISKKDNRSFLLADIFIETNYQWQLEYDHESKKVIASEYK